MINSKVREFLGKFFNVNEVDENDNIFEKGLVSSLFAMQLVQFIEDEFDIEVENDELDLENFKSVHAIVSFIENKS